MTQQDIVIGAVDGYEWPQCDLWANSLKMSGYTGRKALIVYDASDDFLAWATREGFEIVRAEKNPAQPVYWKRYFDIWKAAKQLRLDEARYVIHTDVRDVVFQRNPSEWLTTHWTMPVMVVSEAIKHKDTWFNRECTKQAFGEEAYELLADEEVYCSGVIAGIWADGLNELFLQIFLLCRGSAVANCDQAAMNIIVNSRAWGVAANEGFGDLAAMDRGWACHCAVSLDPAMRQFLTEDPPVIDGDTVKTSDGKPFAIVHQYDRIPELAAAFARKYGSAPRLRNEQNEPAAA